MRQKQVRAERTCDGSIRRFVSLYKQNRIRR